DRAADPDAANGVRSAAEADALPRGPHPPGGTGPRLARPRPVPDRSQRSRLHGLGSIHAPHHLDSGGRCGPHGNDRGARTLRVAGRQRCRQQEVGMKSTLAHFPAASLLALACATIPASMARAQDNVIATMDVDGSNAFVDNVRQPPSGTDIRILDGNLVRTGADTSALVEIIPQGSVQLNENSAKLITESFFKGARCFAAR